MMPLFRSLLNATDGSFTHGPDVSGTFALPASTEPPYGLVCYRFPKRFILSQDNGRVQRRPGPGNCAKGNESTLVIEQANPCSGSGSHGALATCHDVRGSDELTMRHPFAPFLAQADCRQSRQKPVQRNPAFGKRRARVLQAFQLHSLFQCELTAASSPQR